MTDRIVQFFVAGIPRPQGSMRAFVVKNRAIVTHNKPRELNDWRGDIQTEAKKHFAELAPNGVYINAIFVLPRPKSLPKTKATPHHTKRPDLDKLERGLGDALKGVVYPDDACIWAKGSTKRYAEVNEQTGVLVTVQWEEARQMGVAG